jgi:adenylate kinase
MIISFIGPSGSGKGTQAFMLSDDFVSISGGKILRNMYNDKSKEGIDLYNKYWSKGLWVPDDIISRLVLTEINFKSPNILFDAFPRTLSQAIILDNFLKSNGKELSFIFEFLIKTDNILERIKTRGKTESRVDDLSLKSVEKRLDSYITNIKDIREYYNEKLIQIDANNTKEVILRTILSIIENESKK